MTTRKIPNVSAGTELVRARLKNLSVPPSKTDTPRPRQVPSPVVGRVARSSSRRKSEVEVGEVKRPKVGVVEGVKRAAVRTVGAVTPVVPRGRPAAKEISGVGRGGVSRDELSAVRQTLGIGVPGSVSVRDSVLRHSDL